MFNIVLHFQLRGRENLRDLKQNTFKFDVYDDGRECVVIITVMLQKNVKTSAKTHCRKLKEYLQKLPFLGVKKRWSFSNITVLKYDREVQSQKIHENSQQSGGYTVYCQTQASVSEASAQTVRSDEDRCYSSYFPLHLFSARKVYKVLLEKAKSNKAFFT